MKSDHYRRLERMYLSAPFNEIFRPELTISEGEAEVSFDAGRHLHHAGNAVHGSTYFKALDDAAIKVADIIEFTPALNRDKKVPVWISLPITFTTR